MKKGPGLSDLLTNFAMTPVLELGPGAATGRYDCTPSRDHGSLSNLRSQGSARN